MATILIRDLAESVDLDREAMTAIAGGARTPQGYLERSTIGDSRIFNYPAGSAGNPRSTRQGWSSRVEPLK